MTADQTTNEQTREGGSLTAFGNTHSGGGFSETQGGQGSATKADTETSWRRADPLPNAPMDKDSKDRDSYGKNKGYDSKDG